MSDESKEQLSSADTSKEEEMEEESGDTSVEQEDVETSKGDKSVDKSDEEGDDKKDEQEEEEEEEESDDEPQVGLLEKPLILEDGKKRERKKVERISFRAEEKTHEGLEIKEGRGRSLGDIPFIEFKLSRTKAEDCKPLHRLLFRRVGALHDVKKNIRQFSGFPFSKDDAEYEKRVQILKAKSFAMPLIKKIMEVLDIPRSGSKDDLIMRLMEWLEKPSDSGRKLPESKRKRKSKGGSETATKGKKDKKKKEKKKKKVKKTKETADDDDDDEDDDMEEKEEDDKEDDDKADSDVSDISEDEEEPPRKKIKKSTPKPVKEKKTKEKTTPKPKTPKATNKKKATPKKKTKVSSEEVSDVSSDSDDEPLVAKKTPKGPPTNDELKDVIKKMLDNANLEQVTMKTVLKDVFAKYPEFDLSDRKDFIKNTVKQIIS